MFYDALFLLLNQEPVWDWLTVRPAILHRCKKRSKKNKKTLKNVKKRGKNKKRLKTLNKKRWP